jgi:DNA modification methylase
MANYEIIGAGQDTAHPAPKINTIKCGDCLEVMQAIPDKSVDMILCDLPYGTTACKWDSVIDFGSLWAEYKRVRKENSVVVLFGQEPFSSLLRVSNLSEYKYDWIWDKVKPGAFAIAKYCPLKQHELISVFCGGKANYKPIMTQREKIKKSKIYASSDSASVKYNDGVKREYSELYPKTILTFSNASQKNKVHATQKPVALFEYLIRTYTNEGDTVLDNCIGSGTTAIACINTGRNYIGIEKEDKYCRIAEERIHALRCPAQNIKEICHTAPNSASAK